MEEKKTKVTVEFEYSIDEDGIPDVSNVTVDGKPADSLPSEGRGVTAAWDIHSTEYWGIWLELGEF